MDRVQKAREYHKNKYNCCQAVVCAFSDVLDLDEQTLLRLTEGFGLGMGGMEGTCGAVTGAVMVNGLLNSAGTVDHPSSRACTKNFSRQITERFGQQNGSVICKDLKGIETGKVLRACNDCVADAVQLAEELLLSSK